MGNVESFEKDINRLREIVNILENQDTSLDEVMNLCEEGINLTNKCRTDLQTASLKIEKLSKDVIDSEEK